MNKILLVLLILTLMVCPLLAARKALVIGNADYEEARLRNPVNDATLVADKLTELGFAVTKVTNADQRAMDEALNSFVSGLMPSDEAVFYYSGHGANVDGINYLIPVGREINYEADLPYYAFNCNHALNLLQRARITVAVLDACRDNPFRGVRSTSKGLANMQAKAGSQYIIYATELGRTAADGRGNHSPFTESFVSYLDEPLKIEDMMKLVTQDVKSKTASRQIPWTSGNLIENFYFASATVGVPTSQLLDETQVQTVPNYGWIMVSAGLEADVYLDGNYKGKVSPAADLMISNVVVGSHSLEARTSDGIGSKSIYVSKNQGNAVYFAPATPEHKKAKEKVVTNMVYVEGGSYMMGSNEYSYGDETPVHKVTLKSFYIGKYEVTQGEYAQYMQPCSSWTSEHGLGVDYPAYYVSWYASLKYCNLRSMAEGLTPCYTIAGSTSPTDWGPVPIDKNDATWDAVACNFKANGYRLPTEAEWEFAARGGVNGKGYKYSGSNNSDSVAWYDDNSGSKTHMIGTKAANELGIFDLSGNVREWCWDWYDSYYYSSSPKNNPTGPKTGQHRLSRGGCWYSNSTGCSVSFRNHSKPYSSGDLVGFRLCRSKL